jgi:hypothetical protein
MRLLLREQHEPSLSLFIRLCSASLQLFDFFRTLTKSLATCWSSSLPPPFFFAPAAGKLSAPPSTFTPNIAMMLAPVCMCVCVRVCVRVCVCVCVCGVCVSDREREREKA